MLIGHFFLLGIIDTFRIACFFIGALLFKTLLGFFATTGYFTIGFDQRIVVVFGRTFAVVCDTFIVDPFKNLAGVHGAGKRNKFAIGAAITNIGSKITYTQDTVRDFLPANLAVGVAYTFQLDEYNELTITAETNKLLVPTFTIPATARESPNK